MPLGIRTLSAGVLICLTVTGVVYWNFFKLPHPSEASSTQLGYWLVLKDLSQQPKEIQLALIERLIEDSTAFANNANSNFELSDSQTERLVSNLETLKFTWFLDRVEKYHRTDPEIRFSFLQQQIRIVGDWAVLTLQYLATGDSENQDNSGLLFDEVESWLGKTSGQLHDEAYSAVQDAIVCWLGTSSLTEQPLGTRQELASRITRELGEGTQIGSPFDFVPPDRHSMLLANSELLVEAWLLKAANRFAQLETRQERNDFVDQLIAEVQKWGVVSLLAKAGSQSNGSDSLSAMAALAEFSEMTDTWVARAEPESGKALADLVSLVKKRLLFQVFERQAK